MTAPQLGSVFSVLGVLIVVSASCLVTYFITVSAYSGPTGVSSPLLIVFVAFIISFVIGSVFMQVGGGGVGWVLGVGGRA